MFNLSDRDSKLILGLLIVAIIALPYVFYSKDTKADTEIQKARNVQLQQRYDELNRMNVHRQEYIDETERLNAKRDDIIKSFPADVRPENTTMLLHNMEQDSLILTDKAMEEIATKGLPEGMDIAMAGVYGDYDLWYNSVGYGENDILPISEEESEDAIKGVINQSSLTFLCFYDGMKWVLAEIRDEENPMIYRSFQVTYNAENCQVEGTMVLEQYAISGAGRELASVQTTPDNYDHVIEHGNLPYGVFGGFGKDSLYERRAMLIRQLMYAETMGSISMELPEAGEGSEEAAPAAQ